MSLFPPVRIFTKLSLSATVACAVLLAPLAAPLLAVDVPPALPESMPSFTGVVNAADVYVRSGPGDNYYATAKLDKGTSVTVVGMKFDWLKVLPPAGSYSYVAKAYVEKRGDGTVGRVTKPDLNVRAGSGLNAMKTTVQTKLDEGTDVQILGEQDEYFKIKPPADAYLYVNKQFIDLAKPAAEIAAATPVVSQKPDPIPSAPMITQNPTMAAASTTQPAMAIAPSTQPAEAVAAAPTTQPQTPTAEAQFDAVEAAFLDATNQPLLNQPIDDLMNKYTELTKDDSLPVSMRRISELRISTLKVRQDARNQYADAQKMVEQARSRQVALQAEQHELEQRVKEQDVTMYTALGTLRTSSLQMAGGTLYRLTDPGTGRTLLYIRSNEPKYATLLNEFIGVRGDVTEDTSMNLKVITPTAAEAVDESKVNGTVTAQLIPPTLMPKAPTASIAN